MDALGGAFLAQLGLWLTAGLISGWVVGMYRSGRAR
jgi:hypothetical protein